MPLSCKSWTMVSFVNCGLAVLQWINVPCQGWSIQIHAVGVRSAQHRGKPVIRGRKARCHEIVIIQLIVADEITDGPEKLNPIAGVAVKVTVVSLLKFAVHVVGQLIPDGLLVTLPLPASVTVNCVCRGRGGGGLTEPPPQAVSANSEQKTTDKSGNRTRTKEVPLASNA